MAGKWLGYSQVQAVSSRAQSHTMLCDLQCPLKASSFQLNPLSFTKLCHWYNLVCLTLNFLSSKIAFRMQVPQYLMSRHQKPRTEGQNGDGQLAKGHKALPTLCLLIIQSELYHWVAMGTTDSWETSTGLCSATQTRMARVQQGPENEMVSFGIADVTT